MKKILIIVVILIVVFVIFFSRKKSFKIESDNIKFFHYSYSTGNMIDSNVCYEIEEKDGRYFLTIKPNNVPDEEKKQIEIDDDILEKVVNVLNKYDVSRWNNFHKSDKNILDGNSFSFRLKTRDNKEIDASGYMKYPKNYSRVKSELESIFDGLYEIKKIDNLEYLNYSYSTGNMVDSNVYYKVEKKDKKYFATIKLADISSSDEKIVEMNEDNVRKLEEILNKYEISRWDGFQKDDSDVLDGDSFYFILRSNDVLVSASGYMMWLVNYGDVKKDLDSFFNIIYND